MTQLRRSAKKKWKEEQDAEKGADATQAGAEAESITSLLYGKNIHWAWSGDKSLV